MGAMLRAMLLLSAAGKGVAILLWTLTSWRWTAGACFFLPDFWFVYQALVPSSQGLCRAYTRFVTDRSEVWLTIDDGPDAEDTPRLLELLERHGARATFFVIGQRAEQRPDLVADILRRGHEVGHHTQTHPSGSFWCASPARLRAELDRGLSSLALGGARPRWFRAPVGIKGAFLAPALRQRGLACIAWSVRSLDSMSRDPSQVAERVDRAARPGSIILMHEGPSLSREVRVRALEIVLGRLKQRGVACVLPTFEQLR